MKKFMFTSILLAFLATGTILRAQNQPEEFLGLPGDNLNLYAVMKLFQESETLEGFERSLNDQNSNINNLDLNGDNLVDYIRVMDNIDGDVHNIVLQVAIDRRENQDVAVFTVQHDTKGNVFIQLTGDEELYGRNYIIEPIFDDVYAGQTPNPGYSGNTTIHRTTTVEIAAWPVVRYIYMPDYYGWHSSWYYGYYPPYWRSWQPYYWHYYYGYHYNWYNDYYAHYRHTDYHRYNRWNDYYWSGRRSHSDNVSIRIKSGNYRNTYSRPNERSIGEATFIKTHPNQSRRDVSVTSGNNTTRRSDSRSIQNRQSGDNGTTRRSTNTMTDRSVTNPQSRQNEGTSRRSTNSETNRSVSNPQSRQNDGTTRRSTNSETNRSVSNPQSRQNDVTTRRSTNTEVNRSVPDQQSRQTDVTTRRSTNTVTNRSVSNPQSERSTVNTRSSRQSTSAGDNVSGRRSSSSNRSAAKSNNSEKSKSSENRKESRRR